MVEVSSTSFDELLDVVERDDVLELEALRIGISRLITIATPEKIAPATK